MSYNLSNEAWASVAEDVLSILIAESFRSERAHAHMDRAGEIGLLPEHFPEGLARQLYIAALQLSSERHPMTFAALAAKLGDALSEQRYYELQAIADETRMGRAFEVNVQTLIDTGNRRRMQAELRQAMSDIDDGRDIDTIVNGLVATSSRLSGHPVEAETASEAVDEFEQLMNDDPPNIVPTGIDFVDAVTFGFVPGRLWYLAGPYKSRKTTLAMNMMLSAIDAGQSVAFLSLENIRATVVANFVAMLATRSLIREGVFYAPEAPEFGISGASLMAARSAHKLWSDGRRKAIVAGINQFRSFGNALRIYDSTERGGRLYDVDSIARIIHLDKRVHNGTLYFIDHLHLIAPPAQTQGANAIEHNSRRLQHLSRSFANDPITIVALAQLNEATVKGELGYTSGIKGSGQPNADCDVMLITRPVALEGDQFANDHISLRVKFNRWGSMGDQRNVYFDPPSGLMMKSRVYDVSEDW